MKHAGSLTKTPRTMGRSITPSQNNATTMTPSGIVAMRRDDGNASTLSSGVVRIRMRRDDGNRRRTRCLGFRCCYSLFPSALLSSSFPPLPTPLSPRRATFVAFTVLLRAATLACSLTTTTTTMSTLTAFGTTTWTMTTTTLSDAGWDTRPSSDW
jgi:hypothetical protein